MHARAPAMRTATRTNAGWAASVVAAALAASLLVGCSAASALGLDQPPVSLDPASPHLSADGLGFDATELEVPAGEAFVLVFENRDAVSHNVSIYADDGRQDRRFEGVLFGGPGTRWYPVPALTAGTYIFVCDLHPSMAGRLVAR